MNRLAASSGVSSRSSKIALPSGYVFRKRRSGLDFSFTQDQETLRAHLNELLNEVCPPEYAERCDNEAHPSREAYDALGKHGWFGLIVPVEYGGSGGSAIDLAILLEEAGSFRFALA
jgi:alkylation response protein AidB-like acyl-CoA dehydrogenase